MPPLAPLYPLRFQPLLRRYLWGGRRLQTVLAKDLPPGDDYAESWEIVDHGQDQSVVCAGPLRGTTLQQLVRQRGRELLGRHHPQPRFPLLFKFLDAHRTLSVQVHPDDSAAAQLDPPDLGKTEAWVVLHAEPDSLIYAGLQGGCGRAVLEQQVALGATEGCLHRFPPQRGDCVLLPAGAVHALGAGLVVAEIQQASDATFRLYDWDRLGADGRPRPLHVAQALNAIRYELGPIQPCSPQATDRPHVQRLAACDKFAVDRWRFPSPGAVAGDDRCHILAVLEGQLDLPGDPAGPLRRGQTALLPASLGPLEPLVGESAVMLDMYLP